MKQYLDLLDDVLKNGRLKRNRTGTSAISVFGRMVNYDLAKGFPLLTTKKVFFKGIVYELLWFIKGDTNIKYLVDNGVHIWNEWGFQKYKNVPESYKSRHLSEILGYEAYKDSHWENISQEEFVRRIKETPHFAERWGDLGTGIYGSMWRRFPYYDGSDDEGHVDQLQKVIEKLKTDPDSRRMIVSAWHPYWVDYCALPPCHVLFHFNTEELEEEERMRLYLETVGNPKFFNIKDFENSNTPTRRLNLLLYQRSCDLFLGVPFNIASYSLLLSMVAQVVGMVPGTFIHSMGDVHLYQNHIDQAKLQLAREPRKLPVLKLNPAVKSLFDFKFEDITLENYDPHPTIKAEVAV